MAKRQVLILGAGRATRGRRIHPIVSQPDDCSRAPEPVAPTVRVTERPSMGSMGRCLRQRTVRELLRKLPRRSRAERSAAERRRPQPQVRRSASLDGRLYPRHKAPVSAREEKGGRNVRDRPLMLSAAACGGYPPVEYCPRIRPIYSHRVRSEFEAGRVSRRRRNQLNTAKADRGSLFQLACFYNASSLCTSSADRANSIF
jgi:hypothetical protein